MNIDITDRIHELCGIDGTIPTLSYEPVDVYHDSLDEGVIVHKDGDTLKVGYLARDTDVSDFWENDEGAGEFTEFSGSDDPNEMFDAIKEEGKIGLFVQRYRHGLDHYSVAGSRQYPDHNWDVGLVGLHVPCEDVQQAYRKILAEKGADAAAEYIIKDANNTLDSYSDWANGEVYGTIVETWQIEGEHVRAVEEESCWGYIGSDHAVESLMDLMPEKEPEPSL